jgi:iron complex transport system substrate-binding protein
MLRVASLLASGTEIVCALGFEEALVARSHECDWPPGVERLPAVTEPKIDIRASSAAIDREVRALVEEALSIYRVDSVRLRELRPDLIVTQTQCEVCAVSLGDVERALADWTGEQPRIVSLEPHRLADVWEDVGRVARALEAHERGEALIEELIARIGEVTTQARDVPDHPTVATIEWIEPLMTGGNWMPELVAMAGGENLFGRAGEHSPRLNWENLVDADPQVIIVTPCGFDLRRTRAEMGSLVNRPGWNELRAVRAGRVALADGVQWFNRSGPRLVESLEILAEILHPEIDHGWSGKAWDLL